MSTGRCPALLIAAPASGQGKTTVTAALARFHRERGREVRVFKVGPDFIDPMILERACGQPVYQLDLWMCGEQNCRDLLAQAAQEADLILIEGVMGLFDGEPSSADLAALFGIPVLAVIDASAMAQTFGAIAWGLARFRDGMPFAGVFANRVAGEPHAALLARGLPEGVPFAGWLPREADVALPDRHLGLVQADEVIDLDARVMRAAAALRCEVARLAVPVEFGALHTPPLPRLLDQVRIAVARDAAFSFLYRANLDLLRALGAELHFFSPVSDSALPPADSLYLPGGYPELHLAALGTNRAMREAVRAHHRASKPTVAECGGMLYLTQSLTDTTGAGAPMIGLLPGQAVMQPQLAALALQRVELPEGELRGHTFHYSQTATAALPVAQGVCPNGGHISEPVYRLDRLTASYIHFYFPSNPQAVARLFLP